MQERGRGRRRVKSAGDEIARQRKYEQDGDRDTSGSHAGSLSRRAGYFCRAVMFCLRMDAGKYTLAFVWE
jgi:hypothetical protein